MMAPRLKLVPNSSQTVGPFFTIGLQHMIERTVAERSGAFVEVEIRGRVLDGNRQPVPDAMLEFWGADSSGAYCGSGSELNGLPAGFRRVATDENGQFSFAIEKPGSVEFDGTSKQAAHLVVLVFARGLLRNLITRMYFPDQLENPFDPILLQVPEDRRSTLIARRDEGNPVRLHWDVILQGTDETVFFAW
jgi:protocatechuate 3,4-dioxygenase, alpha subunit